MDINEIDIESFSDEDLKRIVMKASLETGRRNKQKENEIEMRLLLDTLYKTMAEMSSLWIDLRDTQFIDNDYPFHLSFDELTSNVYDWYISVCQHVENFGG